MSDATTKAPEMREPGSPVAPGAGSRRERLLLGCLVLAYVGLIGALALSGRFTFVWKTSVVPAIAVTALFVHRFKAFVRDWSIFLGTVIVFDSLRGLIFAAITRFDLPVYAGYAIRGDQALLGGWTLPHLLQKLLEHDGTVGAFEKALVVVHGSHFFVFLVFGLSVWLLRPAQFRRFTLAVMLLLVAGLAIYAAVPTVPPWMAADAYHLLPPLHHVTTSVYNTLSPTLRNTFDVNPIAAMPSLHAALPVLCAIVAWHHFGRAGLILATYACTVCFAIGYLGEHYYVDILAGSVLAVVVYLAIYRSKLGDLLTSGRASTGGTIATMRAAAIGLVLVVSAEGVGQASVSLRRGLRTTEAFARRELVGRSDLGSVSLAYAALDRGDKERAAHFLRLAASELRDGAQRARARTLLERVESSLSPAAASARSPE